MDHLSQELSQLPIEIIGNIICFLDTNKLIYLLKSTRCPDYIRKSILVRGLDLVIGTKENIEFLLSLVDEGLDLSKSSISFEENLEENPEEDIDDNIEDLITDDILVKLAGIHTIDISGCYLITDRGVKALAGVHNIDLSDCYLITDEGLRLWLEFILLIFLIVKI